uniref:Piwi domain-containing protein n=1 Tax=Ascaris lumbricoides TaxID=6252 RepID=A0A0M3HNW3_ASCLU
MRQVCQMMQMTENPSKSIEPLYHRYCVAATLMYSRQKETANMPANEVPLKIDTKAAIEGISLKVREDELTPSNYEFFEQNQFE